MRPGTATGNLCYGAIVRLGIRGLVALLLLAELSACGYHLVGTTSFLAEDIETLRGRVEATLLLLEPGADAPLFIP